MSDNFKVFISWSRNESITVALALRKWLKRLFDPIEIFVSSDISAGERWFDVIAREIRNSNFAIVCLIPDNIHSTWMHFEAGAIFNALEEGRVVPFFFAVETDDISAPLNQFQGIRYTEGDLLKLARDIHKFSNNKMDIQTLDERFANNWKKLKTELDVLRERAVKKLVWIYETNEIDAEEAIEASRSLQFGVMSKWVLPASPPTDFSDCRGFVYVYAGTPDSSKRLKQAVEYLQSLHPKPELIIYTTKWLTDSEKAIAQQLHPCKLANSPDRLLLSLESLGHASKK